ncbi:Pre-mRNA-splicing factor SYF2 [Elasticomyces elasticus]|uniref:Pre-mRNA-splicing factor SYF2 n=1 Tax=Elasticomyces elasticus TaxID=574655 RepID=A0AAN8A6H2_9PEZI|nr:Pre-mRNA-splicing factor SYF2 [Elasticomyces elasticus]
MPKRKGSPALEEDAESSKRRFAETEEESVPQTDVTAQLQAELQEAAPTPPPPNDRASKFAALRARNQASRKANLTDTKSEAKRAATDPTQLTALSRKKDIAAHKLLKAEIEESGEDFERKRAWDWTVEESERWDEKMKMKEGKRQGNVFQDYGAEAGKVYERQVGMLERNGFEERKEAYEKEKAAAVERAIKSGGLEIVEGEDGELIAVDKDGSYYSTADSTGHVGNKPERAAVDRLVADIKKAEEVRLKKRRDRGIQDEGERDVTYINEKNKQFNLKLARFYDKYTADIRESFERGTAI